MNVNTDITYIRCFDLGGGGLKTGLMSYNSSTGEMKLVENEVKLGKCPNGTKVQNWIREQMTEKGMDLDKEIEAGTLFGFSLAGIEKLWEGKVKREEGSLKDLFRLGPTSEISSLSDGSAHTLASVKMLKEQLATGKIWNFCVGTGIGVGFTDEENKLHTNAEMKTFFDGKDVWDVKEPITRKAVHEACSSRKGFDTILKEKHNDVDEAFKVFAARWKAFIEQQIIDRATQKGGEIPTAVVFTGGNIDYYGDRLIKEINKQGLKIQAFKGPEHAALYGAAFHAIEQRDKKNRKTELALKFPEDKHVLYRELGLMNEQADSLKTFIEVNYAKYQKSGQKFDEGESFGIWLPRPVEFRKDGKILIELKGGEKGCTFTPGDLYDPIAGKNLSQKKMDDKQTIESMPLAKEEKSKKIELKFPGNKHDWYRELGLEPTQIDQLKQFIEKVYSRDYRSGKQYNEGEHDGIWLPRPVKFHQDGKVTIELKGGETGCTFKPGDLYDPIAGKIIKK